MKKQWNLWTRAMEDDRVEWTETHYGRGEPIFGQEALELVEKAAKAALEKWGTVYGISDEDYGFTRDDYEGGLEEITSVSQAVRIWWNDYGRWDHPEPEFWNVPNGPKGHEIGAFEAQENV